MVDLVKIRKKKAEKKAQEEAAAQTRQPEAAPPPATTPAHEPPAAREPVVPQAVTPPEARPPAKKTADASAAPPPAPVAPAAVAAAQDVVLTSKLERFKQEAGKRRMTETVQADVAGDAQLELLTFAIAGELYAVDIERIVEIVTPRPLTRVPNADDSILGIISLRGTIVTLVDVRRKLRHGVAGPDTADTRIVVIDLGNETVGFLVDRVLRVVKTAASGIEPPPVVHSGELDEAVRGVFRTSNSLTILLDLDKLLGHGTLAARTA